MLSDSHYIHQCNMKSQWTPILWWACLFVCKFAYLENQVQISKKFLYMPSKSMAQSSSNNSEIRYLLLTLWMTSRFQTMRMFRTVHQVAALDAKLLSTTARLFNDSRLQTTTYLKSSLMPMATTPTRYGWAQLEWDSVKLGASPVNQQTTLRAIINSLSTRYGWAQLEWDSVKLGASPVNQQITLTAQ